MAKSYIYIVGIVAITLGLASAVTEDEKNTIKAAFRPFLEACGSEFGITLQQVIAAREAKNLDALDSCFYACVLKKAGIIDGSGKFNADDFHSKSKTFLKDETDLANLANVVKTCSGVNDQSVSDGDKGCERSKQLLACFIKERAAFTPFADV